MNDAIDTLPQPGEYQQLFKINEDVVVLHGARRGQSGTVVDVIDEANRTEFVVIIDPSLNPGGDHHTVTYSIGDIIGKHYLEVVIPTLEAKAKEEADS